MNRVDACNKALTSLGAGCKHTSADVSRYTLSAWADKYRVKRKQVESTVIEPKQTGA